MNEIFKKALIISGIGILALTLSGGVWEIQSNVPAIETGKVVDDSFVVKDNIDKAKLEAYFDSLAKNNKFMGEIAVSQNGELVFSKSVGFVDIEQKLKANENSKYRIASISKTFTAVLVFKAIEEEKLNLNQTIDKYIPALKNAKKITVADLLYHRSGITNDKLLTDLFSKSAMEPIKIITEFAESNFQPGTEPSYGNVNFILLSHILEKIYHRPYLEILEERITEPLGMKNTYLGKTIEVNDNECNSYVYGWEPNPETMSIAYDWVKCPLTDISRLSGAAGLVSTSVDLTIFADALFNGQLISNHSLQQMKIIIDGYGMGLVPLSFEGRVGFGHAGSWDGFISRVAHFPDSNITFAYTFNGLNYDDKDITGNILKAVYNMPFEIPEFTTETRQILQDEELDKYQGVYSSKQIPKKITIIKAYNTLFALLVGEGKSEVAPLLAIGKDKFGFGNEGIVLQFNSADKTMVATKDQEIYNFTFEMPEINKNVHPISDEELNRYQGVYLSKQIPLKLTIIKIGNTLFGKTSTNYTLLEATTKAKFEVKEEGIVLEFNPTNNTLELKQFGETTTFVKEDKAS